MNYFHNFEVLISEIIACREFEPLKKKHLLSKQMLETFNLYALSALTCPDVLNLLLERKISGAHLKKIVDDSVVNALKNKGVQRLLKLDKISMDLLLEMENRNLTTLQNTGVQQLLEENKFSIGEFLSIGYNPALEALRNDGVQQLLRDNVFSIAELSKIYGHYPSVALQNNGVQLFLRDNKEIIRRIDLIKILENYNPLTLLQEAIAKEKENERQQIEGIVKGITNSVITCATQFPFETRELLRKFIYGAFAQQERLELKKARQKDPEFASFFSQLKKVPDQFKMPVANGLGKIATVVAPTPRSF